MSEEGTGCEETEDGWRRGIGALWKGGKEIKGFRLREKMALSAG